MKVSCGVPENQISHVATGQDARVLIDESGVDLDGTISWVEEIIDPRGRTLPMQIELPENPLLKSGTLCEVVVEKRTLDHALVLPLALIQQGPDFQYLFVLDGDKARRVRVTTGDRDCENISINSGVTAGDEVISEGFRNLVDGQLVKVVGRNAQ